MHLSDPQASDANKRAGITGSDQELAQASTAASRSPGATAAQGLWEILQTVVLALLLFLVIRDFIQNYRVENVSMQPNFYQGQYLVINRFAYCPGFHLDIAPLGLHVDRTWCVNPPQRGDVIVFHYPLDPSQDFIKRVIGLPGETVDIRNGRVFINGRIMSEPFGPNPGTYNMPALTLGRNQVFVLGDNRDDSSDSHVWGPVPMQDVVGRAILRYWPPSRWSLIPHWSFPELASN
jgi:signal peptidase I